MKTMNENPSGSIVPNSAAQAVDKVIRSRKTVRAFRPEPVSRRTVADILEVAGAAPSNFNSQPWKVHVLTGEPKLALSNALLNAHNAKAAPAYSPFPDPLPDAWISRRDDFGRRYYGALGINEDDGAARYEQTGRNFSFFNAPVGLIFTVDARLKRHSWLDIGLFVQNVMLAARARGLDTCPQVLFARYPDVIAEHLKLGPGQDVVCGMSLGLADELAQVNQLGMPREPVERFVTFLGFPD
jgi:nitroreductase